MSFSAQTYPNKAWYFGWNIIAICVIVQISANSLTFNAISLFLPGWSRDMHAPVSELLLASGAMSIISQFMSPYIGVLADRFPARTLMTIGLVGLSIFEIAVSYVERPGQLIALFALLASVSIALSTALVANAVIARWFVRKLGLALGLSAFGLGIGGVLISPLIGQLLPIFGWRAIWRGAGLIVAAVILPLMLLILRDRPTERDGFHYLGNAGADFPARGRLDRSASRLGWRDVLSRLAFWRLIAIFVPVLGVGGACAANLAPIALNSGFDERWAGFMLALLSASHLVTTLVSGMLCDRFGGWVPMTVIAGLVAVGAAVLGFGSGEIALAVGAVLVGMSFGVMTPIATAAAVEFGQQDFGRVFGLALLFLPLASPFPFVLAKVKEATGSYAPALAAYSALLVVSALLSWLSLPRAAAQLKPVRSGGDDMSML